VLAFFSTKQTNPRVSSVRQNAVRRKSTPAVAAGLADHKWTVAELLELVANFRPEVKQPSIIDAINRIGDN
jgi:hypothetical protein